MRILITGATGFLGRNLVGEIDKTKHSIALVVRDKNRSMELLGEKFDYIEFAEEQASYKEEIKQFEPEVVIHLASYLTSAFDTESLKDLLDSNIRFGSLILDALLATGVKYFVNTGSFSEYYNQAKVLDPAYLYSATKIAFRQILDFYRKIVGFRVIQVVPYTMYGAKDTRKKVIDYIIDSTDSPDPVPMTEGSQVLDFIYITDVVDFYLKLIDGLEMVKEDYSEYHLGTGVGTSIRELTSKIEEITNGRANINWGARPYRPRDIMYAVAPQSKGFAELDFRPKISLQQGLKNMLEARRTNGHVNNPTITLPSQ